MASRRMSQSFTLENSQVLLDDPEGADKWVEEWSTVLAQDLIDGDSRIVDVDADMTVEGACELLLSENIFCLAVKDTQADPARPYIGLFDFADVNAFLTFAATRHTLPKDEVLENPRINSIMIAARDGSIPIRLVSNLSDKNPLEILPSDATIVSLLEVFSKGAHRALISSPNASEPYLGFVSDRQLLAWFAAYSPIESFLTTPLSHLSLPSLNVFTIVITANSKATVLDAMKLMSEEGVSSVAVLDDDSGVLLSAVSVTDIGRILVPSETNQVLSTSLQQFVMQIKDPHGRTDGVDRFPVYAVSPTSPLFHTIQKLLTTNSHRMFVVHETGTLSGVVSVVDVLSVFARLAHLPDVDPARMRRHRRASSTSSSRSSEGIGLTRTPSLRSTTIRSPR